MVGLSGRSTSRSSLDPDLTIRRRGRSDWEATMAVRVSTGPGTACVAGHHAADRVAIGTKGTRASVDLRPGGDPGPAGPGSPRDDETRVPAGIAGSTGSPP